MSDFDDLMSDIEAEAQAAGPAAVAELRAFDIIYLLAAEVAAARQAAQMSYRDLAAASGLPEAEIRQIEHGGGDSSIVSVDRLLGPLGRRLAVVADDR